MHRPFEAIGKTVAVSYSCKANISSLNWFIHAINLHYAIPGKDDIDFLVATVVMFTNRSAGFNDIVMNEHEPRVRFVIVRK